jgi:hypothetical protein
MKIRSAPPNPPPRRRYVKDQPAAAIIGSSKSNGIELWINVFAAEELLASAGGKQDLQFIW